MSCVGLVEKVFPWIPPLAVLIALYVYHIIIDSRIVEYGLLRTLIKTALIMIVKLVANAIANKLFKVIYKPGTSWYELWTILYQSTTDSNLLALAFFFVKAITGIVSMCTIVAYERLGVWMKRRFIR